MNGDKFFCFASEIMFPKGIINRVLDLAAFDVLLLFKPQY